MKFLDSLPTNTAEQRMAKENCIAILLTGSHLYGTNTDKSDLDYEGLFFENPEYVIGNKRCEEVDFSTNKTNERNSPEDIDCKLYSVRNFFSLAQKNNPNKIEWFFVPRRNIVYANEKYWNRIVAQKDLFVSLRAKHSFTGYAMSQKHKLITKKRRLDELRCFKDWLERGIAAGKTVIGEVYSMDDTSILRTTTAEGTDAVVVDEKEYNFGMDIKRIHETVSAQIDRYGSRTASLDEYQHDVKFASHLFRLYYEGLQLLKEGVIHFPLEQNKFLLDVKQGKYELDFLLKKSEEFEPLFEIAYANSKLQHTPKQDEIGALQIKLYMEYWREMGIMWSL